MSCKIWIFVLLATSQCRKLRVEAWGIWKQKNILFPVIPMNPEWTISFKIWSRLTLRILKVSIYTSVFGKSSYIYAVTVIFIYWKFLFTPQFLVNHPIYAVTVIFIYLLSDKASNALDSSHQRADLVQCMVL